MEHADGAWTRAVLLRPASWTGNIRMDARDGNCRLWLDLPEFDAQGWAVVEEVAVCPSIQPGKGRVVTSLFHHSRSDQVLTLSLRAALEASPARSERIGVTRGHPFWSQDRGGWVRAGELRTGKTLLGLHGMQVTVESVGSHPVAATYNFEVESDHAYRVGGFGTLVHNLSPIPNETRPSAAPHQTFTLRQMLMP